MFIEALFTVTKKWKQIKFKWLKKLLQIGISQFSSVTQLCPTLFHPMNHSMPGLPVHHQLPEFTQTHVR